jgi:hypothetical protein
MNKVITVTVHHGSEVLETYTVTRMDEGDLLVGQHTQSSQGSTIGESSFTGDTVCDVMDAITLAIESAHGDLTGYGG